MGALSSCTLSRHAKIRSKQRGINKALNNKILTYGEEYSDKYGAHIHVLKDKEIKAMQRESDFYGEKISVDRLRNAYAVTSDNTIVTVGYRYKSLSNVTRI